MDQPSTVSGPDNKHSPQTSQEQPAKHVHWISQAVHCTGQVCAGSFRLARQGKAQHTCTGSNKEAPEGRLHAQHSRGVQPQQGGQPQADQPCEGPHTSSCSQLGPQGVIVPLCSHQLFPCSTSIPVDSLCCYRIQKKPVTPAALQADCRY